MWLTSRCAASLARAPVGRTARRCAAGRFQDPRFELRREHAWRLAPGGGCTAPQCAARQSACSSSPRSRGCTRCARTLHPTYGPRPAAESAALVGHLPPDPFGCSLVGSAPYVPYSSSVIASVMDAIIVYKWLLQSTSDGDYRSFLATPISLLYTSLLASVMDVGPGMSLADKIRRARAYYTADDGPATCTMLQGFVDHVGAQSGKKINQSTAARLIADAKEIQSAIGCS